MKLLERVDQFEKCLPRRNKNTMQLQDLGTHRISKSNFMGRPRNENGRSQIHYNNMSVIRFERS